MKIHFLLHPFTREVTDRRFILNDWQLPLPRKGECVQLYTTYVGIREGLQLVERENGDVLCNFLVDNITYREDLDYVILNLTFVTPYTND